MSSAPNSIVRQAYRHALRTTRSVFPGDVKAQTNAAAQVKAMFLANANASDPAVIKELVSNVYEGADFARVHVAQAVRTESGNYSMSLTQAQADQLQDGDVDLAKGGPEEPKGPSINGCGCGTHDHAHEHPA